MNMMIIPEYRIIEKIYAGVKNNVYRCQSHQSNQQFILKTSNKQYPILEEIARIKDEYKLLIQNSDNYVSRLFHTTN